MPDRKADAETKLADAKDAPAAAGDAALAVPKVAIRITVRPFGNVFVDGKALGPSPPAIEVELAPGYHLFEARNADVSPPSVSKVIDVNGTGPRDVQLAFPPS